MAKYRVAPGNTYYGKNGRFYQAGQLIDDAAVNENNAKEQIEQRRIVLAEDYKSPDLNNPEAVRAMSEDIPGRDQITPITTGGTGVNEAGNPITITSQTPAGTDITSVAEKVAKLPSTDPEPSLTGNDAGGAVEKATISGDAVKTDAGAAAVPTTIPTPAPAVAEQPAPGTPATPAVSVWSVDPASLDGKSLTELNVMVAEKAKTSGETIPAFDTEEEAKAQLSKDYKAPTAPPAPAV